MKKAILILLLSGLFSISIFAQKNQLSKVEINFATFKSDGCSLFPDGDYRNCCVAHDLAYFSGGSWTARWRADKNLYKCVVATKGFQHKLIAPVMWLGVRAGGLHFFPTPFRWGFGRRKIKINNQTSPAVRPPENPVRKFQTPPVPNNL
jgi:hypothetical protein